MSKQAGARIDGETFASYKWYIATDVTLNPVSQTIVVDSTDAAIDVTLPDVAEAAGVVICVIAPEGTTNDVSVLVNETGLEVSSGGDMDTDDNVSVFYCTGLTWVVLHTTTD